MYKPGNFGGELTPESVLGFVERELLEISRTLQETTVLELRPLYAAPDKPREGMIVCADGTHWNPGGGKGVYAYLNGAWSKL